MIEPASLDLQAREAKPLPTPQTVRWKPLRSGLLNLYLYDEQIFEYEQGHLLLRGHNGTGKSRALALQLPFLLDGEISPQRLEPDGDPAKRMEWNLLMGKYPDRLGYTWIEFGRIEDAEGEEDGTDGSEDASRARYLTLGCGLRASTGRSLDRWFFVTDRRVGESLSLTSDGGQPLTRDRLQEALGERGQIYRTVRDYRRAVDQALFQLGEHRYLALVNLLIQLRQPQLSRQLDERKLSNAISEALPPLADSVVSEVAESFRSLESDRDTLASYLTASEGIARFLTEYGHYSRLATARQATTVRTAHSVYESTQRARREVGETLGTNVSLLDAIKGRARELAADLDRIDAEIRTLESSPEMRSVRELDAARRAADDRQRELAHCRDDLARATDELEESKVELDAIRFFFDVALSSAREARAESTRSAAKCDLRSVHERWLESVSLGLASSGAASSATEHPVEPERIDAAENALRTEVGKLEEGERELRRLHRELDRAQRVLETARQAHAHLEAQLESSREELTRAHAALTRTHEELLAQYQSWRGELELLEVPTSDELVDGVDDWVREGVTTSPITEAIEAALHVRLDALRSQRAARDHELEALQRERTALVEEQTQLEAGVCPEPPPARGRDASARDRRAGATFWKLVDFVNGTSPADRAGVEGALESAGLLDAWVTPDGRFLDDSGADVFLCANTASDSAAGDNAATAVQSATLAAVLRPAAEPYDEQAAAVGGDVLDGILRRIAYASDDGAASTSELWVNARGQWRMGPARGCSSRAEAELLGQPAREASRRRRLAEIGRGLGELDARIDRVQAALDEIATQVERAQREASAAPDESAVVRARAETASAQRFVALNRERVLESETRLARKREAMENARSALCDTAADLGLSRWRDDPDALAVATREYDRSLDRWWTALREFARRQGESARGEERRRRAEAEVERWEGRERAAQEREGHAIGQRDALEATVGKDVEDVLSRLASVRSNREQTRHELDAAGERRIEMEKAVGIGREKCEFLDTELHRHTDERDATIRAFERFARTRLPSVALPRMQIEDAVLDGTAELSPTRAIDLARDIARELDRVPLDDDAWARSQRGIYGHIETFKEKLLAQSYRPSVQTVENVVLVEVPFQGRSITVSELAQTLTEEIAQRQQLLDAREREVIENHLIGDVAIHIGDQLRAGEEWVREVNAELQARPMSTGMALRFAWPPREDGPPGLPAVRRRLLGQGSLWSPEDREAVGTFLKQQIDRARAENEGGTWREHLVEALDYRLWHRFVVERRQDGKWVRLTRRTHGTGSSGEKSVALTIPQFAAVAAHYRSAAPHAPRLVLLDEVFVSIDSDMRGKCMGLLQAFDLDFVMTSESEWGTYPTVGGVAIYHLSTREGVDAIGTTRWVWNGRELLVDDDDER